MDEDRPAAEEALGILSQQGYESLLATSARKALRCLAVRSYDCVLVDLDREEVARPVIEALRRCPADAVSLIITGSGPAVSAIGALRQGALDYVRKPYDADILKASAARAIERSSLSRTIRQLVEDVDSTHARLHAFAIELQQRVDRMTAELRRNVDQLDDANRQLAEERRRREEFIAMVAHDLAGPFTTISGYVQVLTRANVAGDVQQRARTMIISELRRMVRLLRDLSDVAPLASGRFRVQPVSCELTAIVKEQTELAQLRSDRHQIRLDVPPSSVVVLCDPDRFVQVLSNLLDNAIKYSPGGEVMVRLWVEDTQARLLVRDQGPGIPPDLLQSIFEPRVRVGVAAGEANGGPQGAGLGLYIARGIVEALHGRIWAESDGLHGAALQISLPLHQA